MNERLQCIRRKVTDRANKEYRTGRAPEKLAEAWAAEGVSYQRRSALRLKAMLEAETPVVLPEDRIAYIRTVPSIPSLFTEEEWKQLCDSHFIFDGAKVCNISSDYGTTIRTGLAARRREVQRSLETHRDDPQAVDFLESCLVTLDAVRDFARRYREEAVRVGNTEVAHVLSRVPEQGATTFHEALQFFRILNYTLWINGNHHITVGRFDQYMRPYFEAERAAGTLDDGAALELLEDLFLSLNKDSDLYHGVQQGDNGQSMMLGGCDEQGEPAYNDLSALCLKASLELNLIDPKINLRVDKNTPLAVYQLGTELTKQGLGFPQYSNDDVVIPGLRKAGYTLRDARNYTVAACWEFIIPGTAMDIPNIDAVSFPQIIDRAVRCDLSQCATFDDFLEAVRRQLNGLIDEMLPRYANLFLEPSPFQSLLMDGCVENGRDISAGLTYNNYGLHGVGVATAADSLAGIRKVVYDDKTVTPDQLLAALDANYEGYEELQYTLVNDAPKMGNNDDAVDSLGVQLLDMFADALKGRKNERGGIYRAGTGTAMYYLWSASDLPATPDGRRKGEPFGANFSPSLNRRLNGPLSVIQSFAKPHFERVPNGGPLTLELHDTLFRNQEGSDKVAMLVKTFVDLGGQQMQLNAINRDRLADAQAHPENYKNLIVRVWGWSGYFVELDKEYQDHIMRRVEFVG